MTEQITNGFLNQGHFARVSTLSEVRAVMDRLLENRKIANATHNIYAYRIRKGITDYESNHLIYLK